jgi:hypothetical protein
MYSGEDEQGSQAEAAHGGVARQVAEVSFAVHNILASIADEEERFATILMPPPGRSGWDAGRGQAPHGPSGRQAGHAAEEDQRHPHPRQGRGGRRDARQHHEPAVSSERLTI